MPVARCIRLPKTDNPVGIFVRQRPQQDFVHHAENGGVRTDPQGQGEDRHQR